MYTREGGEGEWRHRVLRGKQNRGRNPPAGWGGRRGSESEHQKEKTHYAETRKKIIGEKEFIQGIKAHAAALT